MDDGDPVRPAYEQKEKAGIRTVSVHKLRETGELARGQGVGLC
jgi:hypothetical protein